MIDVVRRATELNDLQSEAEVSEDPFAFHYSNGQIQILEFIIEGEILPEDMKDELITMYENSLFQCQNWGAHNEEEETMFMEILGATDVLAWVLDIPEKEHKKRLES